MSPSSTSSSSSSASSLAFGLVSLHMSHVFGGLALEFRRLLRSRRVQVVDDQRLRQ